METAQRIVLGSATAIASIGVMLGFMFAFVLVPLIAAAGFALVLLLYQVIRKDASRR
jgi:hypothetical protein